MFVKKMTSSFAYDYAKLVENVEISESYGLRFIRVKTTDKVKLSLNVTIDTTGNRKIIGFDQVFANKRTGRNDVVVGALFLYPSYDHYRYGYLPATERNLLKIAAMIHNGVFTIDEIDEDLKDRIYEICEERGYKTTIDKKLNMFGKTTDIETAQKQAKLTMLKEQIAKKSLDDEIAELEKQLVKKVAPVVEPVVTEVPVVEPVDVARAEVTPQLAAQETPVAATEKKVDLSKVKLHKN